MSDNKKEVERAELHRTIWKIADELRGSVDGWDFKQNVLGMLFYRYISENLTAYINGSEHSSGNISFDYSKLKNSEINSDFMNIVIEEKGFFIHPEYLFENVRKTAKDNKNLNETLSKIFNSIEASAIGRDSEKNFKGLFHDLNVNDQRLGGTVDKRNQTLTKLLNNISEMKLGDYEDNTNDLFGDAYEYLIGMYAQNAGKSGGEYYTPQEVSELLARLTLVGNTGIKRVYDPACGSGSLLLKFAKLLNNRSADFQSAKKSQSEIDTTDGSTIEFYGQEKNVTTYNLCRMNMFLHNIEFDKFNIEYEDTLMKPIFNLDKDIDDLIFHPPFQAIVTNPPYALKWDGDSNPLLINDPRYSPAGVLAPKSKADMAFIMHCLSFLAPEGTSAIVCFPGILYRGGAEQKIRQYLIDNNFIDCIIQLPSNLFYGTSIATCIMVLKKNKKENKTLFIDSSNEFIKVTNSNKLTEKNIERILDAFRSADFQSAKKSQSEIGTTGRVDIPHFCKYVHNDEVAKQGYNLSVSTYVEKEDTREVIDIVVLNEQIKEIVARQSKLREELDEIIKEIEGDGN